MFIGQIDEENIEFALGKKTKKRLKTAAKVIGGAALAGAALKKGAGTKLGKSIKTGFKAGARQTSQTQGLASRAIGGVKGAAKTGGKRAIQGTKNASKAIGTKVKTAPGKAKAAVDSAMTKRKTRIGQRKKLERGIRAGLN